MLVYSKNKGSKKFRKVSASKPVYMLVQRGNCFEVESFVKNRGSREAIVPGHIACQRAMAACIS